MELRWLFLDMNSFFASCEQQEDPVLRGRPVAVAPVDSDATSCIAASYEAKAYGIKCGTNVGLARRLCPDLVVIHGRHEVYAEYHRQIMRLLRAEMPGVRKLSVDEIACPLGGNETTVGDAVRLGMRLKRAMYDSVGECMHCSVGIAPNVFLAKVATELHKPRGLVALVPADLPGPLVSLHLTDFPGIGRKMLPRLQRRGIQTVEDLYAASPPRLRAAWGGVVGERWWHMLRGSTQCDYVAAREHDVQSIGHSHVLAPPLRTADGAEGVLLRLAERAITRLRQGGFRAGAISVGLRYLRGGRNDAGNWAASSHRRTPAADPFTIIAAVRLLWSGIPDDIRGRSPLQVSVMLGELVRNDSVTLPLFDFEQRNEAAAVAMDGIRAKFGTHAVEIGSVIFQRHGAREAIAFGKVTDDGRDREDESARERSLGMPGARDPRRDSLLRV